MKSLKKCVKTGWCADCIEHCWFAGNPGADCPRWRCINTVKEDCEHCEWLADYKREVEREGAKSEAIARYAQGLD